MAFQIAMQRIFTQNPRRGLPARQEPDVLAKATPLFSTKAGSHTGLGLIGCAQMVAPLKEAYKMASHPGQGTLVQMSVPRPG